MGSYRRSEPMKFWQGYSERGSAGIAGGLGERAENGRFWKGFVGPEFPASFNSSMTISCNRPLVPYCPDRLGTLGSKQRAAV